jgi:hypothetical protein
MQLHISTQNDTVTVHADVTKIEVEDIVSPGEDDECDHISGQFALSATMGKQSRSFVACMTTRTRSDCIG